MSAKKKPEVKKPEAKKPEVDCNDILLYLRTRMNELISTRINLESSIYHHNKQRDKVISQIEGILEEIKSIKELKKIPPKKEG